MFIKKKNTQLKLKEKFNNLVQKQNTKSHKIKESSFYNILYYVLFNQ